MSSSLPHFCRYLTYLLEWEVFPYVSRCQSQTQGLHPGDGEAAPRTLVCDTPVPSEVFEVFFEQTPSEIGSFDRNYRYILTPEQIREMERHPMMVVLELIECDGWIFQREGITGFRRPLSDFIPFTLFGRDLHFRFFSSLPKPSLDMLRWLQRRKVPRTRLVTLNEDPACEYVFLSFKDLEMSFGKP